LSASEISNLKFDISNLNPNPQSKIKNSECQFSNFKQRSFQSNFHLAASPVLNFKSQI